MSTRNNEAETRPPDLFALSAADEFVNETTTHRDVRQSAAFHLVVHTVFS
jgi:hypothetical protein